MSNLEIYQRQGDNVVLVGTGESKPSDSQQSGSSLPEGGTEGQVLVKKSSADGDAEWQDAPSSIPDGGNKGQVLSKKSDDDGDSEWVNNQWIGYGSELPDVSNAPDGSFYLKGSGSSIGLLRGANGVSGYIPDYDKAVYLSTEIRENLNMKWPYNRGWIGADNPTYTGIIADNIPDDGWACVVIDAETITKETAYVAIAVNDKCVTAIRARLRANVITVPVKKGDSVSGIIATSFDVTWNNPNRSCIIFCPTVKPEITEERIVGYYSGKPVYEIYIDRPNDSAFSVADYNIDRLLDFKGTYHGVSGSQEWALNTYWSSSEYTAAYFDKNTQNIHIRHNHTNYNNKPITINIKYTKTTD